MSRVNKTPLETFPLGAAASFGPYLRVKISGQ